MKLDHTRGGVSDEEIMRAGEALPAYIRHIKEAVIPSGYEHAESSVNLPGDKGLLEEVGKVVSAITTPGLRYVLVVGIGGSNLGTKAVYDALYGYEDLLAPERAPKCVFVDTTDPKYLSALVRFLETHIKTPEEIAINIISKSGHTTETIVNAEIILSALGARFPSVLDRVVVTTTFGSALWKIARERGMATLAIPEQVGGRYSVFSAVGLFPLALLGVNITALLEGARDMREECLSEDALTNPAWVSAAFLVLQHTAHQQNILDTFFFHPELESVGKWYRQLLAESLGKEHNRAGATVREGITPTVSIGTTDLHSVGQLTIGGPRNKATVFVGGGWAREALARGERSFEALVPGALQPYQVMEAVWRSVEDEYHARELPFLSVSLLAIDPNEVGAFLQWKMMEVMYAAHLLEVNAFDQPAVEGYKERTRAALSGQ